MKKINLLISTFFGNGYISKFPGSFTSLNTLIILYILFEVLQFKNLNYILSFILFRFFDIVKPFPVSYFDKQHKNFFGIIMDDIMAGLYTMLIIYLISLKF